MADGVYIQTPDGTFRISAEDLERFRIDEGEVAEVEGFMHGWGGFAIQPEGGGDDLFTSRTSPTSLAGVQPTVVPPEQRWADTDPGGRTPPR